MYQLSPAGPAGRETPFITLPGGMRAWGCVGLQGILGRQLAEACSSVCESCFQVLNVCKVYPPLQLHPSVLLSLATLHILPHLSLLERHGALLKILNTASHLSPPSNTARQGSVTCKRSRTSEPRSPDSSQVVGLQGPHLHHQAFPCAASR